MEISRCRLLRVLLATLAATPLAAAAAAAAPGPQTTEPARLEERQAGISYMWLSITNGASQCKLTTLSIG
jgi:hypothetical protein